MKDIFISYNWGSKEDVQKIVDLLRSKDEYQVWMDDYMMAPGDQFRKEIKEGINNCKLFIAFITKNYCDSLNCQSETHYAFDKKKKCIYVMLEENLGDDPTGISLIVASSLRLNAYLFVSHSDWPVNLYETLSKSIKGCLNNTTAPILIDLETLIMCRLCNNRFNLDDSEVASCRKPIQTNCNIPKLHENVLCMRCLNDRKRINSLGNQTFLCPFDKNEHLLTNCTDANRLHSIIRYFETRECFYKLKENSEQYSNFRNQTEDKIIEQVNESKRKIKEHVEGIINKLNNYVALMTEQLDKHVDEWKVQQESIKDSLKIDEIIKSTEDSMSILEKDLKKIEIIVQRNDSYSIDENVDENMRKINDTITRLNSQISQESKKLRNEKTGLNYKKGCEINNINQVVGTLENNYPNLVDMPEIVELCCTRDDNFTKIKELIEYRNANVHYRHEYGYTALIKASGWGHFETIKLLIQNGANVNEKNDFSWSALMGASEHSQLEIAVFLIQNGANVNEKNNFGDTALIEASKRCHLETVKLLIENGANINEKNDNGYTALHYAKEYGGKLFNNVANYLKSKGAK